MCYSIFIKSVLAKCFTFIYLLARYKSDKKDI